MSVEQAVLERSAQLCELCGCQNNVHAVAVAPKSDASPQHCVAQCDACTAQIETFDDPEYWRCLSNTMWSIEPPVQVTIWRILNRLSDQAWVQDWLSMMVLEDDVLAWAQDGESAESDIQHKDANGHVLTAGDTVTLIKDLDVKGANFTAKRGTAVRGISLVPDNAEHIEGRVNGQRIVILTQYVKKS